MSLRGTTVIIFAAIILALGGTVARSREVAFQTAPLAKTSCNTPAACLTETNKGTGAAIEGISLEPKLGAYGQAAILARSEGIGGMYSFSKSSYGGEFESGGKGYALIAASDNSQGTAFLAETASNNTSPAILAISRGSGSSAAIIAESPGYALEAISQGSNAGYFETDTGTEPAIEAVSYASPGFLFQGSSPYGAVSIDTPGNGRFSGSVSATSFVTYMHEGNTVRGAFGSESTRASLEDTGTARLGNGRGIVRFDPAFAEGIDANAGYQVFLTPDGDTRGLYVAQKFAAGFVVREALGGHSSTTFDYRVVARPLGASDAILPQIEMPKRTPLPKRTR
ncbi:MAG: hypothetical protein ABIZ82_04615 [Candidatus Tumulicola sp.]